MYYDLGDSVALRFEVRDVNGALANAGGGAVVTVTAPDGTTSTPAVSNPTTGVYTASPTPTLAGRHTVRWVASGTNACAYTDIFVVVDPAELALVGLADLKTHLNITGTGNDDELRGTLLAATQAVEDHLNRPIRRLVRVETYPVIRGNGGTLVLSFPDVASITSVTCNGVACAASDYTADTRTGVLYKATGWTPPVVVTYVTRPVDSPTVRQAVLEMSRHLWDTQRGSMKGLPRSGDTAVPGTGYSLPNRVLELLEPLRSRV